MNRPIRELDGTAAGAPPALPAATVVLLRPGPTGLEVLLTRRPSTMAFGPDLHVFPGGRVEDADRAVTSGAVGLAADEAGWRLGLGRAPDDGLTAELALALHAAAVRETLEETGIEVGATDLVALTRWVTPPSLHRRFDVRFFAAVVAAGTEVVADSAEVVDATWQTPTAALAAAERGDLSVWQPTFVTLQQLAGLADVDAVRTAFAPGDEAGGPVIEQLTPGLARVNAPWAAGIPGRRATGWLVGVDEVVAVDPTDPTTTTLEAMQVHLGSGRRLAGAVATSLEPERHAGVEMLAHGLGVPVVGDARAQGWTPYPVTWLSPADALPFGDAGNTFGDLLAGIGGR